LPVSRKDGKKKKRKMSQRLNGKKSSIPSLQNALPPHRQKISEPRFGWIKQFDRIYFCRKVGKTERRKKEKRLNVLTAKKSSMPSLQNVLPAFRQKKFTLHYKTSYRLTGKKAIVFFYKPGTSIQ
jgi:hypothetical protein